MNVKRVLSKLFEGDAGRAFKGMATLAAGTGMARVVGLISIPILTRIYSPSDYGVLSLYASVVALLAPTLTLRYAVAIPLPRSQALAANLLVMSAFVASSVCGALAVVAWLWGENLLSALSMEALVPWRWLVIIGALATASYELLSMWATRQRAYGILARTQVLQAISGETLKVAAGLFGLRPGGLMVGHFVSQSGGLTSLALHLWKDMQHLAKRVTLTRLKTSAVLFRDYPVYRLPSQVLLVFSMQAPVMFAAAYYGPATTGQLGLALMAIGLPVNLLSDSMSKAYYAEISAIGRKQPALIRRMTHQVMRRLFALSLAPALVLLLGGRWLFEIAFGQQWSLAGQFASMLSVYLVLQFIQRPVSYLLFLFNGQRKLLLINVQRATITTAWFYIGAKVLDLRPVGTILGYALLISLHYVASVYIALRSIPADRGSNA